MTHRDKTEVVCRKAPAHFRIDRQAPTVEDFEAIKGILEEGDEVAEDYAESEALDAGLLAGGQAVEHYEMSRYGTLRTWARQLGMKEAAELLEQTLQEEKKTDALLTRLAELQFFNRKAA